MTENAHCALDAFGPASWTRPEITCYARAPMHTYLARPDVVALDGQWRFARRDRPDQVLDADLVGATAEWSEVEVPGCWTMQGFDSPHYTNVQMPFAGPPPNVPDANPTGVYRRTVTVPATWRETAHRAARRRAQSRCSTCTSTACRSGMGKDSRLPHEFDLTGLVEPGDTFELALTVVRWSDATYLEDQDHWYHAGLHRSVFLYATPPVYIADVHAIADYDPDTGDGRARRARRCRHDRAPRPRVGRRGSTSRGEQADAAVYFEHHELGRELPAVRRPGCDARR